MKVAITILACAVLSGCVSMEPSVIAPFSDDAKVTAYLSMNSAENPSENLPALDNNRARPLAVFEPSRRCGGAIGNSRFSWDWLPFKPDHREPVRSTMEWLVDSPLLSIVDGSLGFALTQPDARGRNGERQFFQVWRNHDICLANQPNAALAGRQRCDAALARELAQQCDRIYEVGTRGRNWCETRASALASAVVVFGKLDAKPKRMPSCTAFGGWTPPRDTVVRVGLHVVHVSANPSTDELLTTTRTKDRPDSTVSKLRIAGICSDVVRQSAETGTSTISCGASRGRSDVKAQHFLMSRPAVADLNGDGASELILFAVNGLSGQSDVAQSLVANIVSFDANGAAKSMGIFPIGNFRESVDSSSEPEDGRRRLQDAIFAMSEGPIAAAFVNGTSSTQGAFSRQEIVFPYVPANADAAPRFGSRLHLRLLGFGPASSEVPTPLTTSVSSEGLVSSNVSLSTSLTTLIADGWAARQSRNSGTQGSCWGGVRNQWKQDLNRVENEICHSDMYRRVFYPPLVIQDRSDPVDASMLSERLTLYSRSKAADSSIDVISVGSKLAPVDGQSTNGLGAAYLLGRRDDFGTFQQGYHSNPCWDAAVRQEENSRFDRVEPLGSYPTPQQMRALEDSLNNGRSPGDYIPATKHSGNLGGEVFGLNWLGCGKAEVRTGVAADVDIRRMAGFARLLWPAMPLSGALAGQPQLNQTSPSATAVRNRLHSIFATNCDGFSEGRRGCPTVGRKEILRLVGFDIGFSNPARAVVKPDIVDIWTKEMSVERPNEKRGEAGEWLRMPSYSGRFGPNGEAATLLIRCATSALKNGFPFGCQDSKLRLMRIYKDAENNWHAAEWLVEPKEQNLPANWAWDGGAVVVDDDGPIEREALMFTVAQRPGENVLPRFVAVSAQPSEGAATREVSRLTRELCDVGASADSISDLLKPISDPTHLHWRTNQRSC